jgi:hypothetical protein
MLSQAKEAGVTAPDLRVKAYRVRHTAKRKLDLHKESCPTCCNDTWKTIDALLAK